MSVFEKNGMLQRQDQIEIKRQENAILSGSGTDTYKAMQIDALYQARGLQPGSFYRADFDQTTGSNEVHEYTPATKGEVKLFGWAVLFLVLWGVFAHYFPNANEWAWEVFRSVLQAIFGLIGMAIGVVLNS